MKGQEATRIWKTVFNLAFLCWLKLSCLLLFTVPISDQHFELDTLYLEDISVILCVVIVFNLKLNLLTYFRLERKYDGNGSNTEDLFLVANAQMFTR